VAEDRVDLVLGDQLAVDAELRSESPGAPVIGDPLR
jgi:hypothetical protein